MNFFFASFVLLLSNNTVDCQMIINFFLDGKSTKIKMGFKDFKRIHQGFFCELSIDIKTHIKVKI